MKTSSVSAMVVAALLCSPALAGDKKAAPKKDAKQAAAQVKCEGINECKGKGACGNDKGASCAGTNECKGKGWVLVAEKDCKDKKGTVLP